jgi:hypothetical protein
MNEFTHREIAQYISPWFSINLSRSLKVSAKYAAKLIGDKLRRNYYDFDYKITRKGFGHSRSIIKAKESVSDFWEKHSTDWLVGHGYLARKILPPESKNESFLDDFVSDIHFTIMTLCGGKNWEWDHVFEMMDVKKVKPSEGVEFFLSEWLDLKKKDFIREFDKLRKRTIRSAKKSHTT